MNSNQHDHKHSTNAPEFSNAYSEINKLIEMATSIQNEIKSKRREIRFSLVKLIALFYFFVAIPFLLKPILVGALGFNVYLSTIIFSLTTVFLLFLMIVFKIRDLKSDLKIDIATMQDLMDVIFNFRKVFNIEKHGLSVVEITILDLKLRQLRFY
ncbi:hypothetical protein D4X54_01520 [Salmonella enterica subsp. enterica serovar Give]|uniref:hypothetical protein n=1 Tax=Citrobacter freundii TaxID=546 RepID=UPI00107B2CC1|nr:hypothetical protein [Citrobacter freundii]EAA2010147.1 hypothetical protein [Salmonella enterica subsp. enterica serovar Give]ECJ9773120.1 DUF2207 domain-containing protein [Salmonella enterica]EBY4010821.1 hypothetical protein [Salmonella enterica subsp. enterica serovar Give]EBZ7961039.1 hypothetical protein [Salmonella enterica subsp. enterica serovar Give]ECA5567417.1 hypothetical protein [Salmonella enterica subsp. enterica serovar Give]